MNNLHPDAKNNDAHKKLIASVVVVTGISGAGRYTALRELEDIGYEAVDNLPLSLLKGLLVTGPLKTTHLAIGLDARSRDFSTTSFINLLNNFAELEECRFSLLFLDCDTKNLLRRFSATRRRHPFAPDEEVTAGIARERRMLNPIRDWADRVIDTTEMSAGDLKRFLNRHYAFDMMASLGIFVMSFSYRKGVPQEADLVFDTRFLKNPFYVEDLRPLMGTDKLVGEFIEKDESFPQFFNNLKRLLEPLIPRFEAEGKKYLTIGLGCTGGHHRSVFVAERVAEWLKTISKKVEINHRELASDS